MKLSLPLIISLIAFSLFNGITRASHISGGEITYQCLGNNQYKIRLSLFRDCSGIDMSTAEGLSFASSCSSFTATANLVNPGGTEISQICSSQINSSTCNGGTLAGMEQYNYEATVTMAPCYDWEISWNTCCRNQTVNVPTSTGDGSYLEATMNSTVDACNNSPAFYSLPIPSVCINQQVTYNFSAFDTDGDSLVYSFIAARNDIGSPLTYTSPYTATNPINGITINQSNGTMNFTPTTLGNFIVVVAVSEYNSTGQLIGTILRDIQFYVVNCSGNMAPDPGSGLITGLTGNAVATGSYAVQLCSGGNFSFTISVSDTNSTNSVSLSSDILSVLPGAVFTPSNGNPATATISWADTGAFTGTKNFVVYANDNVCPIPGIQTYIYSVTVIQRTFASLNDSICGNQSAQLSASGGTSFLWSVLTGDSIVVGTNFSCNPCANPLASPDTTTAYMVTSNLTGGCTNKDTVIISVVPDFTYTKSQTKTTACMQEQIQFTVSATGTYSYQWQPASVFINSTVNNPVATFTSGGNQEVFFTITSAGGCSKTDSMSVLISSGTKPNIVIEADSTICSGSSVTMEAVNTNAVPSTCGLSASVCTGNPSQIITGTGTNLLSTSSYPAPYGNTNLAAKHQILFTAAEINALGFPGGQITSLAINIGTVGSSTLYNNFEIKMGCTSASSLSAWQSGLSTVFPAQSITIYQGWNFHNFNTGFDWDGVSNIVVEICFTNPTIASNSSTYYTTTTFNSVLYYAANAGNLCSSPGSPIMSTLRPNMLFSVCSGGTAGYSYSWSPSYGLSSTTIVNPVATITIDTSYTVIVVDTVGGCADTASISLDVVPGFTYTKSQSDSAVCLFEQVQYSVIPDTSAPSYTYLWSPGTILNDSTISSPTATYNSAGNKKVYVQISNSYGCTKTDSLEVVVSPAASPDVTIIADSVICAGIGSQIFASSGSLIPANCGISTTVCSGATSQITVGTESNVLANTSYPAPYGHWYMGVKHQILYTAAELNALGFSGGQIKSLALNVASISGTTVYKNFEIKMGCSSISSINNWVSGLVTVFPAQTINITTGWNTHTFASSFDWDGSSNVIVEICFNNQPDPYTTNSPTYYSNTSFNSVIFFNADNNPTVCSSPSSAYTSTFRPNMRFTICNGGGTGTFTYSWTPSFGLSDSTVADPVVTISNDTTYTVIVSDSIGGCADTASIFLNVIPGFTYSLLPADTSVCTYDTILFSASVNPPGNYIYDWSPNIIFSDTSAASPYSIFSAAGNYKVRVMISNGGCEANDSISVQAYASPSPVITGDADICLNDSSQLSVSGGVSYNWSPSTGLSASNIANPVAGPAGTTTYLVTVTNAGGCSGTDSFMVSVSPLPSVNLGPDQVICDSALLDAGTGYSSYQWSNGTNNQSIVVSDPGIYFVKVKDAKGCMNSDTLIISLDTSASVEITFAPDTLCLNDNFVVLTATPAGGTWLGDGTSPSGIFSPALAGSGMHTIVYTVDIDSCKSMDQTYIYVDTCTVGVSADAKGNYFIRIYPNPGKGRFSIGYDEKIISGGELIIYNMLGEIIYRESPLISAEIDLKNAGSGIYLLQISGEGLIINQRLIIE